MICNRVLKSGDFLFESSIPSFFSSFCPLKLDSLSFFVVSLFLLFRLTAALGNFVSIFLRSFVRLLICGAVFSVGSLLLAFTAVEFFRTGSLESDFPILIGFRGTGSALLLAIVPCLLLPVAVCNYKKNLLFFVLCNFSSRTFYTWEPN